MTTINHITGTTTGEPRKTSEYVQYLALSRLVRLLDEHELTIFEATFTRARAISRGPYWGYGVPRPVDISAFEASNYRAPKLRAIIKLADYLAWTDDAYLAGHGDSLKLLGETSTGVAWEISFSTVTPRIIGEDRWNSSDGGGVVVTPAELIEILRKAEGDE